MSIEAKLNRRPKGSLVKSLVARREPGKVFYGEPHSNTPTYPRGPGQVEDSEEGV
jgi:hypothetical protein